MLFRSFDFWPQEQVNFSPNWVLCLDFILSRLTVPTLAPFLWSLFIFIEILYSKIMLYRTSIRECPYYSLCICNYITTLLKKTRLLCIVFSNWMVWNDKWEGVWPKVATAQNQTRQDKTREIRRDWLGPTQQILIAATKLNRAILVNNQLDALFSMYLFISLLYKFRATQCLSSGESNCINTSSGVCHSV